nr:hypothetical protein [Candidatus Cloacimonadota bacterium]
MAEKHHILVVDDSIAIVNSLQSILSISGFNVDKAYNACEAMRKLHNGHYDLVISDIEMPGTSGLEFLSMIREEFGRQIDVILMTGYLEQDYFIEAIRLGASDFIRKPIDTKQIVNSIRELFYRRRNMDDITEFYSQLDKITLCFDLNAAKFSKYAISKIFSSYLQRYFKIDPKTLNELLVCLDEMIYNAYIHGTLGLSPQERSLPHEELIQVIEKRFADPKIKNRKVELTLTIDNLNKEIEISVKDDGGGFDHENWLKMVRNEQILDIKEYGRGLVMLYHLSDELSFENDGRLIRIRKKVANPIPDEHS